MRRHPRSPSVLAVSGPPPVSVAAGVVLVLARRADIAAVIGAGLAAKAAGAGYRRVAAELGRPAETVRGWLRRFAGRVEAVRVVFTGWCRALAPDPDPVLPGPAGSGWADAVAVITAAAATVAAGFGIGEVAVWEVAVAVSAARLLAPGWPPTSAADDPLVERGERAEFHPPAQGGSQDGPVRSSRWRRRRTRSTQSAQPRDHRHAQ
jgi:hypothetical protein